MNETVVLLTHQDVRLARQGGVHGVPGQLITQKAIINVGRHAADVVARIEVFQGDRELTTDEVRLDFFP